MFCYGCIKQASEQSSNVQYHSYCLNHIHPASRNLWMHLLAFTFLITTYGFPRLYSLLLITAPGYLLLSVDSVLSQVLL